MPELSSYLAERYLTADTKPPKKRKRKHDKSSGGGGLLIQDDDDWGSTPRRSKSHRNDDDDDLPITVGAVKQQTRKTTKANWKTVQSGGDDNNNDSAAADAILAAAAAEAEAARKAEEDGETPLVATMADGSHAGLQSAAAVMAQLEKRQRQEREAYEAELAARGGSSSQQQQQETVYRDATGRRVDTSTMRAEARRAAEEAERREKEREGLLKGAVQVEEAKRRREALEEARGLEVARRADDVDMNEELKRERRWNDPMARFLDAEDAGGGAAAEQSATGTGKKKAAGSRRPVYKGPAAPNRYGIRPGYRWDGVDRSNGHEAERFKGINRRERNKGLEYQWQMDE